MLEAEQMPWLISLLPTCIFDCGQWDKASPQSSSDTGRLVISFEWQNQEKLVAIKGWNKTKTIKNGLNNSIILMRPTVKWQISGSRYLL